ncbi:MAG: PadR family transcriptional regulator [Dehalococcoidia bacterium]|nr:PadR family transcriptional regulator [Dehalococcoidia bacterium]
MTGEKTLPPTAYAILGMLAFDDGLTAYEVKRRADRSLAFFYWSPAMSAVYTELERLASLGYAQYEAVAETELRAKRVYSITEAGQEALRSWVAEGEWEPNQLKHFTALRIFNGHVTGPEPLIEQAERHAEWARERYETLLDVQQGAEERLRNGDPSRQYPLLVIEWGLDYYDLERQAAERLARRLRKLAYGDDAE